MKNTFLKEIGGVVDMNAKKKQEMSLDQPPL